MSIEHNHTLYLTDYNTHNAIPLYNIYNCTVRVKRLKRSTSFIILYKMTLTDISTICNNININIYLFIYYLDEPQQHRLLAIKEKGLTCL